MQTSLPQPHPPIGTAYQVSPVSSKDYYLGCFEDARATGADCKEPREAVPSQVRHATAIDAIESSLPPHACRYLSLGQSNSSTSQKAKTEQLHSRLLAPCGLGGKIIGSDEQFMLRSRRVKFELT